MKKLGASAFVALALFYFISAAQAQRFAEQEEFQPEEYANQGQTNGCGISVLAVWKTDAGEVLGVSESVDLSFVPEHKTVTAMLRANAFLNGKPVPVSYAWIETTGYGRTTDFTSQPTDDPNAFISEKKSDPKTVMLVGDVVEFGAGLGITIKGRTLDEGARVTRAPEGVASKVQECLSNLASRIGTSMQP
jgi:hypothetical protein